MPQGHRKFDLNKLLISFWHIWQNVKINSIIINTQWNSVINVQSFKNECTSARAKGIQQNGFLKKATKRSNNYHTCLYLPGF